MIEASTGKYMVDKQGRMYAAAASGFSHSVARDLDLLVSGIMRFPSKEELVKQLEFEAAQLLNAIGCINDAITELGS